MKSFFILIASILLIGAVLCGCSDKDDDKPETKNIISQSVSDPIEDKSTQSSSEIDGDINVTNGEKESDKKTNAYDEPVKGYSDNSTKDKQKHDYKITDSDYSFSNRVEDKEENPKNSTKKENFQSLNNNGAKKETPQDFDDNDTKKEFPQGFEDNDVNKENSTSDKTQENDKYYEAEIDFSDLE